MGLVTRSQRSRVPSFLRTQAARRTRRCHRIFWRFVVARISAGELKGWIHTELVVERHIY